MRTRSSLIKYANDNVCIRAFYSFITGPYRAVFYVLVCAAVIFGLYLPMRDLYIAYRSADILEQQLAIRDAYKDALQAEVESYLSEEGIEAAAREEGMVLPGEKTITVTGEDDGSADVSAAETSATDATNADAASGADAQASSASAEESANTSQDAQDVEDSMTGADSSTADTSVEDDDIPTTTAEVQAAEKAVYQNSPWYFKVLDVLFFFTGVEGQAIVSTGSSAGSSAA